MGQTVSNVIFDVGNVLIDFCWEKTCEMLHFSQDIIDAFEKNMILTDVWDMLDEGTISLEHAILRFIEAMPQYEKEVRLFWEHADTFVEEYDYAFELIKELKEKGYKVYLLSNYPLDMYKLHWPAFRFFELVDGYIVSAVEKLRKPDIRIYKLLCERYGLEPSACVFFDDRQINVDAAIEVGMQGILFESDETVKQYFDL
ncbi:MAG: HAD family hydrolase [Lachnospiraceae bacterium]